MRLLRLKPADEMADGLAGCPFKGTKFTWVTESNEYERWIAASRGEYTVMWNLRRWVHRMRYMCMCCNRSHCSFNSHILYWIYTQSHLGGELGHAATSVGSKVPEQKLDPQGLVWLCLYASPFGND
jgi:hypothetical protein